MNEPSRSLLEFLIVAVVGTALAFGANQLSPRGLELTRNYFPRLTTRPVQASDTQPGSTSGPAPNSTAPALTAEEQQIVAQGLHVISDADVWAAYQDPRHEAGLFIFIDARKDEHYAEGHIPGAYQFYHYEIDKYLPQVLPLVLGADKVIVYCGGGECDDSVSSSIELLMRGADATRLFVYAGGMNGWKKQGHPVERGTRGSGDTVEGKP